MTSRAKPVAPSPVERITVNRRRYYRPRDTTLLLPSVTTILDVIAKPALIGWATRTTAEGIRERLLPYVGAELTEDILHDNVHGGKGHGRKKLSDAADVGTRTHEAIEMLITQGEAAIDPELTPAVDAFELWWEASGLDLEYAELKMASLKYGYGGSTDIIARRKSDGRPVIVDLKTSNGIYDEMALQVAAYGQAYEETFNEAVADHWVIRLAKERVEFEARRVEEPAKALSAFLGALELWRGLHEGNGFWGVM